MDKIEKIENSTKRLDKALERSAVILLGISVIGAVINVFLRYVLDMSFQILEELCRYTIIYGVFAYIGPLIKKGDHLKMDILQGLLKGKWNHLNNLFISIILLVSYIYLSWSGIVWAFSLLSMNVMTVSGIMLMFIPAIAIPIGMLIASLYSVLQIFVDFQKLVHHKKEVDVKTIESNTAALEQNSL